MILEGFSVAHHAVAESIHGLVDAETVQIPRDQAHANYPLPLLTFSNDDAVYGRYTKDRQGGENEELVSIIVVVGKCISSEVRVGGNHVDRNESQRKNALDEQARV